MTDRVWMMDDGMAAPERRCATCDHWRHDSGQWGECRPPLPWWHEALGGRPFTMRCEGEDCAAWSEKNRHGAK